MDTLFWLIEPTGHIETGSKDLPAKPGYADLKFIAPLIRARHFEHVTILYNGERRDMFVDELGLLEDRPYNPLATMLYRQNTMVRCLAQGQKLLPSEIGHIVGPAVFFPTRQVWF